MKDICKLVNKLRKYYELGQYEETLNLVNRYIDNKNYGIFDNLLDVKMNCLIKLGRFKEAGELLTIINYYFPNYNTVSYSVSKYIICNEVEKALELLVNSPYDADAAFNMGRVYSLMGQYQKAKDNFFYAYSNHSLSAYREKARKNIEKIDNYAKKWSYVPRDYKYFKSHGGKLRVADVIYVDDVSYEINSNKLRMDKAVYQRPFLIWKIVGGKIYAFPLTVLDNSLHCFSKERYPNVGNNRYPVPYLVLINENDVNKICDHIFNSDFIKAMQSIYRYILSSNYECIQENNIFINSINYGLNVKKGDIIRYYDNLNKKIRRYYVLDVNDDSYEVIEVFFKDNRWIVNSEILLKQKDNYIYNVFSISIDEKSMIDNEIKKKVLKE